MIDDSLPPPADLSGSGVPELDYVRVLQDAKRLVNGSVLYRRFIEHTPLENDIAVWMANFACAQSDRLVADLHAALARAEQARQEADRLFQEAAGVHLLDTMRLREAEAARATAEQERDTLTKRLNDLLGRIQFVFLGGGPVEGTDEEIFKRLCEACDKDRMALRTVELERDARVSVEGLRGIYASVWETVNGQQCCMVCHGDQEAGHSSNCVVPHLLALCADTKQREDNDLARVTRQRDALQGERDALQEQLRFVITSCGATQGYLEAELAKLKADQAGHDLIVTHALRTAQEQVEAAKGAQLEPQG